MFISKNNPLGHILQVKSGNFGKKYGYWRAKV